MSADWDPYSPTPEAPWDLRRVVHLHRRAGFAATWGELQRDLEDGPKKSIDRLREGRARGGTVPTDFEARAGRLAATAVAANRADELGAAWVYRMLHGPDPLGERLALLWHNHFATSNEKLRSPAAALRQVATFRDHARAPFGELLGRAVRDPALLAYLDAPSNRKGKPNENLARELMELFTLGVGNYSEKDVKEAARCLTGWTLAPRWDPDDPLGRAPLERSAFREDDSLHDGGEKVVLGKAGKWSGSDLVRILLDHPATADRLARRLADEFLGEGVATAAALRALATGLRETQLDVGKAVGRILRSRLFFAAATADRRVPGPAEWAVCLVRRFLPLERPPGLVRLAGFAARLGQGLFYPPNVGGWPGGRAWLSPLALVGRANLVAAVVWGRLADPAAAPVDVLGLAQAHRGDDSPEAVVGFVTDLVLGGPPDRGWAGRVLEACGPARAAGTPAEFARRLAAVVVSSPEAQLG